MLLNMSILTFHRYLVVIIKGKRFFLRYFDSSNSLQCYSSNKNTAPWKNVSPPPIFLSTPPLSFLAPMISIDNSLSKSYTQTGLSQFSIVNNPSTIQSSISYRVLLPNDLFQLEEGGGSIILVINDNSFGFKKYSQLCQ